MWDRGRALCGSSEKRVATSTYAEAGFTPDRLSLASFRYRALRLWLVAISLLAFGAAYLGPIVQALRVPEASGAPLPLVELPRLNFVPLVVPKLRPVPALPAPAAAPAPAARAKVPTRPKTRPAT